MNAVSIGLDDGHAVTKIALPDGRLIAVASRARIGRVPVTWLDGTCPRISEYETEGQVYAVGDVDAESTQFDGYPFSGLNRAIVQHALQQASLAGSSLHVVSGLPVSRFYGPTGKRQDEPIERKRERLKHAVTPLDGRPAAGIAFHEVIPEALAAWYDHVITESDAGVRLAAERLAAPMAVIDIGGRTTDFVVVAEQAVIHASSGSLLAGWLDVKRTVGNALRERFAIEVLSERATEEALQSGQMRLFGQTHDVSALIVAAARELSERIHTEAQRQLGRGAELDRVLIVGGGALALAPHLRDWFPNQQLAEHPAFANARGMLKYLRYVCQEAPSA